MQESVHKGWIQHWSLDTRSSLALRMLLSCWLQEAKEGSHRFFLISFPNICCWLLLLTATAERCLIWPKWVSSALYASFFTFCGLKKIFFFTESTRHKKYSFKHMDPCSIVLEWWAILQIHQTAGERLYSEYSAEVSAPAPSICLFYLQKGQISIISSRRVQAPGLKSGSWGVFEPLWYLYIWQSTITAHYRWFSLNRASVYKEFNVKKKCIIFL